MFSVCVQTLTDVKLLTNDAEYGGSVYAETALQALVVRVVHACSHAFGARLSAIHTTPRDPMKLRGLFVSLHEDCSDLVTAQGVNAETAIVGDLRSSITCTDQQTCAPSSTCTRASMVVRASGRGLPGGRTMTECSCAAPRFPPASSLLLATSLGVPQEHQSRLLLPYGARCLSPRVARAANQSSEVVRVRIRKRRGEPLSQRAYLSVFMEGSDSAPAGWAIAHIAEEESQWLSWRESEGVADASENVFHIPLSFDATGLPERLDPYTAMLRLVVTASLSYTRSFTVDCALTISAEADAAFSNCD